MLRTHVQLTLHLTPLRALILVAALTAAHASIPDIATQGLSLLADMTQLSAVLPPSWHDPAAPCTWEGLTCSADGAAITHLHLGNASARGPLPPSWPSSLPALTWISLENNHLTSSLPPAWSAFTVLDHIILHHNHLTSTLPPQWSALTALVFLNLDTNNLTGSLPGAWAGMEQIDTISVQHNQLSGVMPQAWRFLEVNHVNVDGNARMCGEALRGGELVVTSEGTNVGEDCPSPPPLPSPPPPPPVPPPLTPPLPAPPSMPESDPTSILIWSIILLLAAAAACSYFLLAACQPQPAALASGPWEWARRRMSGWMLWSRRYEQVTAKDQENPGPEGLQLTRTNHGTS